jgi:hypothetical protein
MRREEIEERLGRESRPGDRAREIYVENRRNSRKIPRILAINLPDAG